MLCNYNIAMERGGSRGRNNTEMERERGIFRVVERIVSQTAKAYFYCSLKSLFKAPDSLVHAKVTKQAPGFCLAFLLGKILTGLP